MTSEYLSSDFSYKKYSLEQLDNWLFDAMNCEDLTPQDIYDTIVRCVDQNVEHHKKHLTRNIELLSLLKGNPPSDYIEHYETTPFSEASEKDWVDFWDTIEETPDKVREYELKEREYERQRAMLDAQNNKSKYYFDTDRNR